MTQTVKRPATPETPWRRHRFLTYQGYAFPWYATLIWISFFVGGLIYFVSNVLLG